MAEAVAVLGPSARLSTVAALVGLDLLTVSDGAEELVGLGLVEFDGDPVDRAVSFVHPIVGAAVHDAMTMRARADAHAKAADVVDRAGAEPERVAAHVLRTPPGLDRKAVRRLRRAARRQPSAVRPRPYVTFLDRCLHEELADDERLEILRLAADAAVHFDLDAAVRLLEQARQVAGDDAGIHAALGVAYGFLRQPEQAIRAFTAALAALSHDDDDARSHDDDDARSHDDDDARSHDDDDARSHDDDDARSHDDDDARSHDDHDALSHDDHDAPWRDDDDARRRLEATLLVGAFVVPGRSVPTSRVEELAALPHDDGLGARMLQAAISLHEMACGNPVARSRAHAAVEDGTLVREVNR